VGQVCWEIILEIDAKIIGNCFSKIKIIGRKKEIGYGEYLVEY